MINFFQHLIEKSSKQMGRQEKQLVMELFRALIPALVAVIPYERKNTVLISKVAQCFVYICN